MSDFSLKKWYLDAADDQGNLFIGYWISLHWRALSLSGYQYLWHSPLTGVKTQSEMTRQPEPSWQNPGCLLWQNKGLSASWESAAEAIGHTICSERGKIEWRCLQPKAKAKIELLQLSFAGWGYSEYINIDFPIWQLPFKQLYWGRTHSANHYLVWIKLDGPAGLNAVWYDGKPDHELVIGDTQISGSGFNLELGENLPLRKGKIISTVLKPFENLLKLFPKNSFLIDEQKWYNRGLLKTGKDSEKAITIYEKVTW
jgi:hypothetical protein